MAQSVTALQKDAQQLETVSEEKAFLKYQEILKLQPANIAALCKSSELCSSIGRRQKEKEEQLSYFKAAQKFASQALSVNPNSSEANFVMSIAMGRMALVLGGKEKIAAVDQIKKYAELSIKCDPSNYKPYHVLGRWHYEVSDLSGFERAFAKIFYGGVPPATLKEAIYNYEKCRSLAPDLIINYVELARCYHRNDQKAKAIEFLNKALSMPEKMQDDKRVKEEARVLLKKWS
ncbi:MAG: tetratricopeptide repeat protein [Chitinophagaceae bacterium]